MEQLVFTGEDIPENVPDRVKPRKLRVSDKAVFVPFCDVSNDLTICVENSLPCDEALQEKSFLQSDILTDELQSPAEPINPLGADCIIQATAGPAGTAPTECCSRVQQQESSGLACSLVPLHRKPLQKTGILKWNMKGPPERERLRDFTNSPTEDAIACVTFESVGGFAAYFIPIAYMVVFLLDLMGNGLVLYVLIARRSPWLLADHYLFQLALSDLLLGFTLPFWAFQYSFQRNIGSIPCKILGALFTINIYSTIFFLVCISINRYFSIVHAIELHKRQRPLHTVLICIFIWMFSCTLSWQEFYFRESKDSFCTYNFPLGKSNFWRVALQLVELTIGFIIPLVFMVFSYSRILCTLRRSRHNHSRRSQLVIIVLLLVFVLCWAPYKALQIIDSLQRLKVIGRDCYLEKILDIGMIVTEALGLSHVCINPIVYAFVGVKFRREIFKIFKRLTNQVFHSTAVTSREGTVFTDSNCSYSRIM
ncbi:C-X-C chemokine receptor type 3-like [Mantella aurantiaca]